MPKGTALRKIIHWGKYILLIAVVALVVYWIRFSPVSVNGHSVKRGEITAEVMGTGTLESRVQMTVSSKIAGRISELLVDQADEVQEGQVLLRLDDSELKQQVEIARSALAAAEASLDRAEADAVRTQAVLNQVKVDHRRIQQLYTSRSISSTEMERSAQSLNVAEAEHNKARAAVMEAKKKLIQARNTLDYQQARLADTVITAPLSGLIVRRDREPGDIVVPGTPIFLLISTTELWISAWVDETEMNKLAPGQNARVVFRSEPNRPYSGVVVRLGRETDRETRQFIVDVKPDRLPENWAVGQRAEVFIQTAHKTDAVLLPSNAILIKEGEKGVLVEEKGRAVWRPVKVGLRGKEEVEIVEGLEPGETVITSPGSKDISAGRKVEVTDEPGR
ncbi:MAG TPA: efflux RND transporter periplasmic adaptor subunit [Desulfobacteraceae bacterium]|nr:efflux RND transporter periplasmic adaptor subunit [Desulfobacteraceae bacterium]